MMSDGPTETQRALGRSYRKRARRLALTADQIAIRAGIARAQVFRVFRGHGSFETFERVGVVLRMTVSDALLADVRTEVAGALLEDAAEPGRGR